MSAIPRSEYPRPQFQRQDWLCLNGDWQFEIDHGDSGLERGLRERELSGRIVVPFCPESKLSGVEHLDFMDTVWYRRQVAIPAAWAGREVLLHFGAVDYDTTVWVNGQEVRRHRGGWTSFSCELAGVAAPGETATIVVRARDPRGEPRPAGKQSIHRYDLAGCMYTRTTGIWQTVWLEPVAPLRLERPRITPDVGSGSFRLELPLNRPTAGLTVRATLSDDRGQVGQASTLTGSSLVAHLDLAVPRERVRLWQPGDPHLYELDLELRDASGKLLDRAQSYAGLRSVSLDGRRFLLNGKAVFQRQVLDQGYYPDGILTAPSDEALRRDIELAQAAGFNSARLHQKVFEERFLYHADRLGYLVWGEFGDWGFAGRYNGALVVANPALHQPGAAIVAQWLEALARDYNHPCIVGWCPLNESAEVLTDRVVSLDDVTRAMFLAAKAMDCSRPVLDASGYSHRVPETDVYDSHDYDQNPETLRARHAGLAQGRPYVNGDEPAKGTRWSLAYRGQPYFVSEFGGIWWNPAAAAGEPSWGYGDRPRSLEEFYQRFEGLCNVLLDNPDMFGFCYTQLTDVFQEQNGIYRFDRGAKFDLARLRRILSRPAACER